MARDQLTKQMLGGAASVGGLAELPADHIQRWTYGVEEAGAMADLGRNASYEAVKRGEIPVLRFGRLLRVPKAAWDRKLRGEPG